MAYKVFFIARVKDYNDAYEEMSEKVYDFAKTLPGFISLTEEHMEDEHGTTEITVTTWKTKEDVMAWRTHPIHMEAKARAKEWYHWVVGKHVETVDDAVTLKDTKYQ